MGTISLRFTNNFAPECGTIEAHETIIREKGYVWYGKMGTAVSKKSRRDDYGEQRAEVPAYT